MPYYFLYLSATINLGVWRHICLSLDFEEGLIILVENAETRIDLRDQEKVVKMFKDFSPTFGSVSVGCGSADDFSIKSTIGSISDFQIWDSVLPLDKMLSITGCQESSVGNLLSWEGTNWQLNSSSNVTKSELPFNDICGSQDSSLALIPYTMSMVPRALHQCSRLGGQVVGYSNETELHDTARFLVSRSVVHRHFGITTFFRPEFYEADCAYMDNMKIWVWLSLHDSLEEGVRIS